MSKRKEKPVVQIKKMERGYLVTLVGEIVPSSHPFGGDEQKTAEFVFEDLTEMLGFVGLSLIEEHEANPVRPSEKAANPEEALSYSMSFLQPFDIVKEYAKVLEKQKRRKE